MPSTYMQHDLIKVLPAGELYQHLLSGWEALGVPSEAWAETQRQNKNVWLDLKENFTKFIKYSGSTVIIRILLFQSLTIFSSIGKRNSCPPFSLQLNSGSNTNLQERFGGFPPNPALK